MDKWTKGEAVKMLDKGSTLAERLEADGWKVETAKPKKKKATSLKKALK